MKLYKLITDDKVYFVFAEDKTKAEIFFIDELHREKLDDELSDLFDIEEVTKPQIIEEAEQEIRPHSCVYREIWEEKRAI